jgi:hypothetical protein
MKTCIKNEVDEKYMYLRRFGAREKRMARKSTEIQVFG